MPELHRLINIFFLSAAATGLPVGDTCISQYPLARHVVPLYRTALASAGNFEADIQIGAQTVRATVDTGSSDTWFMTQGTQCLNAFQPTSSANCGYNGTPLAHSPSFEPLPHEHLNLSYGIGDRIIAVPGSEHIVFGGIDVPKQLIGRAKTAATTYVGHATGLIGLAYPILTNLYPGNDPSTDVPCSDAVGANDTGCNIQHYSPLLSTVFKDGLTPPIFAFAISRSAPHGGLMTIGGIPDIHDPKINISSQSMVATVPIEKPNNLQHHVWYLITVEGLQYEGASETEGKGQYVVDSGTIQTLVGKEQAAKINALFDPPAVFSKKYNSYFVQCDAVAPELGVNIGGETFMFNKKDLILDLGPEFGSTCESGIQVGTFTGDYPPILSSLFMRNVLAVFDVGKTEMTFASRPYYEENIE